MWKWLGGKQSEPDNSAVFQVYLLFYFQKKLFMLTDLNNDWYFRIKESQKSMIDFKINIRKEYNIIVIDSFVFFVLILILKISKINDYSKKKM